MDKAEDILARFPGPVTLASSRRKWGAITAGAAAFTAIGILLALKGDWQGFLAAAFFGPCAAFAALMLVPGASELRLDAAGFAFVRLFRVRRFGWDEVSEIGVWTHRRVEMVVFRTPTPRLSLLEKVNVALAGVNQYLPDTYGLPAEDLVRLMMGWQDRARRRAQETYRARAT